jgi:hypothetical protein
MAQGHISLSMREIRTYDKSASSGRTHSRESAHKHKEESSSSIKSQRKGDKKKKMKKVVYYETDSSSPSTSGSESASATSKRHERKKYRIRSRKSHSGSHHAFMYKSEASSSRQSTHAKLPKKKSPIASNEPNIERELGLHLFSYFILVVELPNTNNWTN